MLDYKYDDLQGEEGRMILIMLILIIDVFSKTIAKVKSYLCSTSFFPNPSLQIFPIENILKRP